MIFDHILELSAEIVEGLPLFGCHQARWLQMRFFFVAVEDDDIVLLHLTFPVLPQLLPPFFQFHEDRQMNMVRGQMEFSFSARNQ